MRSFSLWVAMLAVVGCNNEHAGHGGTTEAPSSVAVSPITFDAVFAVNGGSNSISVIDAGAKSVASTIQLTNAMYPHHIYLSADRSKMLVAVPGIDLSGGHEGAGHTGHAGGTGGAVLLMDATTGKTLASMTLEGPNHNAIFSPDGSEVWTSHLATPGDIIILDGTTLEHKMEIPVGDGPEEVTFSLDGKYGFVANGSSNSVSVLDTASKQVIKTIPVGQGPVGPWPGNDNIMYVDNESGKTVSAIDVATLSVVRTYDLGFTPGFAATAPGGELWVTDSDNGKVVFYAAGTSNRTGEATTGAGAHAIAFSADGKTGYVTNQAADSLTIVDVATHTAVSTIATGSKPNGLVFRAR